MSPLEARKRLLIAESEVNRSKMATGLAGLGSGVATIIAGASKVETLISSLAAVIGLWRPAHPPAGKPIIGTVINMAATLWQMFRRRS